MAPPTATVNDAIQVRPRRTPSLILTSFDFEETPDCQSIRGEQTPPWIGRDIVPPSTAWSSRLGPTIKRLVTRGSDRPSLLTGPDAVDPDSVSGGSRTVDG